MPTLTIRHGPRGTIVWTGPLDRWPAARLSGPYHGVLPRALMSVAPGPGLWPSVAPELDAILGGQLECASSIADVARAAGVRSYRDSARVAVDYALSAADGRSARAVELWSVKEGHTASVWRLRLDERTLALNVARDDVAAAEQRAAGRELRELHARDPAGVVEVVDMTPDVVACAWLDGRELHVIDAGAGLGRFVAVERFVTAPDGRQLMIAAGRGAPASDAIWAAWLEALVRQTTISSTGVLSRARVEACEGDLMLVGDRPVLVGLTPGPITGRRDEWLRDLLDLRSGTRDPILRWGNRGAARAALERARSGDRPQRRA